MYSTWPELGLDAYLSLQLMQSHPFHLISSQLAFDLSFPLEALHLVHTLAVLIKHCQLTLEAGYCFYLI